MRTIKGFVHQWDEIEKMKKAKWVSTCLLTVVALVVSTNMIELPI